MLLDGRHSYIHKYESNASMLSRVIFYLQSVNFLFSFSIVKLAFTGVTLMILNFQTDRSGETVQTQIRLLLEEQSDQGLHFLLFHLHVFDKIPSGFASLFEF